MSPSISFAAEATSSSRTNTIYNRPAKKPKMSITQTYFLAHSARGKLSKEASRPDHDLRLLVGHANMLDSLMLDLANAEQEQERWFNQSVPAALEQDDDEHEEEEESSPEDLAVDESEDWSIEDGESTDSDDEESHLTLTRTKSRHSPPELTADADSDSEDEHMPSSPPDETLLISEKERQAITTTSFYDAKDSTLSSPEADRFEEEGFFIPSRSRTTIIAAY